MKAAGIVLKSKKLLRVTKLWGIILSTPKCENTRRPKILAYKRDKVVIHQNVVVWDQIYKNHRGSNFAMQEDFTGIAKISLA